MATMKTAYDPKSGHSNTAAAAGKKVYSAREATHQAQKERQEQVTEAQSLTLVKNLIRVSISTVCSLRNVFPSACFQERTYAGMKIFQLDAATRDTDTNETVVKDQEAYDLTMWLESGVFEAVEKRYLRRMEFIIMSPDHENPREAYSFDLTYPEDPRDGAVTFGGTKVTTAASTKGQLVKLIRSLIAFGHTLGELPRERILNVKLWYFEERTPADWQPKFFREADPAELKFSKAGDDEETGSKIKIQIGDLNTPHHTLSLRFTGYDNQEQQQHDDQGEGDLLTCKAGPEEAGCDDSDGGGSSDGGGDEDVDGTETPAIVGLMNKLDVSAKNGGPDSDTTSNDEHGPRSADDVAEYHAAKAWAVAQNRPTITGLTLKMGISKPLAREFLDRMVLEGLFVKRNFRYHRCLDPPEVCRSSQILPSRKEDGGEEGTSSGGDTMDVDYHVAVGEERSSSQASSSSFSDDSETQAPDEHRRRQEQPRLSMPPPAPPGGRQSHTPEARGSRGGGGGSRGGRDYATPPVPKSSAQPDLQPIPEKPQRAKMVTMGTKRVLDDSTLSGHDDNDNDYDNESSTGRSQENSMRQEDEPIDVFNPDDMGSETGYERMVLSQVSTTSAAGGGGRSKRKCSLAINPIYQSGKRLRVEGEHGQ